MATPTSRPADSYSPLYFLASLGAGGLVVTFFMYLMFWVPHPGQQVPIFEDITAAFATGSLAKQAAISIAVAGIAFFAFLNVKMLLWNLSALARFKKTGSYTKLRNSNTQSALLAGPLAAAMTVNALFIVGLVFVPKLWTVVEVLFPLAMIAFALIGLWALRLIGDFLGRILGQGGAFDMNAHNSFAQLMPAFALSMVAVGFSAPSAMSSDTTTIAAGLILSTFFGIAAVIYMVIAAITGFGAILQNGMAREAGPTLMVIVPLMTVLGIMALRQNHGLHVAFDAPANDGTTLLFITRLLAVQVVFALLGMLVLLRQGYFTDFVFGTKTSPGSYALVCPGVALSVMLHFFVNKGLVSAGVIDKYSAMYWAFTLVALALQWTMVALVLRLNRQHFGTPRSAAAIPAE